MKIFFDSAKFCRENLSTIQAARTSIEECRNSGRRICWDDSMRGAHVMGAEHTIVSVQHAMTVA